jgi:hypothetical protein
MRERENKEEMDSAANVASPTISEETGHSKFVVHGWAKQKSKPVEYCR